MVLKIVVMAPGQLLGFKSLESLALGDGMTEKVLKISKEAGRVRSKFSFHCIHVG
jgi:hypothetical protein